MIRLRRLAWVLALVGCAGSEDEDEASVLASPLFTDLALALCEDDEGLVQGMLIAQAPPGADCDGSPQRNIDCDGLAEILTFSTSCGESILLSDNADSMTVLFSDWDSPSDLGGWVSDEASYWSYGGGCITEDGQSYPDGELTDATGTATVTRSDGREVVFDFEQTAGTASPDVCWW